MSEKLTKPIATESGSVKAQSTPIYAVGDVHGQIELLRNLIHQIKKEHGTNYQLVLTGDIMDRSVQSFETFRYIKDNPNITSLFGNHDAFYAGVNDPRYRLEAAFLPGNGGFQTIESILSYFSKPESNFLEKRPNPLTANDFKLILQVLEVWRSGGYKAFPGLKEKARQNFPDSMDPVVDLVCDSIAEFRDYARAMPFMKQLEVGDNKFVMTHSGHVPTTESGKIKHPELYTLNDIFGGQNGVNGVLGHRPPPKDRVDGHIVLHGHTPKIYISEYVSTKGGHISAVNLDGGAGYVNENQEAHLRAMDLTAMKILSVYHNRITEAKLGFDAKQLSGPGTEIS